MTDSKTADRDVNRAIRSWLHEDRHEDASRVSGVVLDQVDTMPQRRATWWPARRTPTMNKFLGFGVAAAAVVVALVIGAQLLGSGGTGGVGGAPTTTPQPSVAEPTEPTPSPLTTPPSDLDGVLAPGTYVMHPLQAPDDALAVTFTVAEGWLAAFEETAILPNDDPGTAPPGGMAILFEDVTSLNGDPCAWSGTDDDVSVGPTVSDLVEALSAQRAYEVSDPVDVTIGGYSGTRVDIVAPTEPFAGQTNDAPDCDEGAYRFWSTAQYGERGIYVQGPADRWHTNILDVDGRRLVIVARDFAGTSPADRADMDAIIDSFVIEP